MRRPPRLVLVTGTVRSGSTAVGDVLGRAPGARTIYEPFNRWVGMREIAVDYPVPGTSDLPGGALPVDRLRRLDFKLKRGVFPHDRGWRRLVKYVTGSQTTMTVRLARLDRRATAYIWKDPMAVYCIDAARREDVPVIVTIRNPWATAASYKRLGWGFDIADLTRRLTAAGRRPSLDPSALEHPEEPVTNGAANWAIALEAVLTDRAAVHDAPLVLVDMDAIVANPVERYRGLYDAAGLTWTDKIAASIHAEFSRDRGDNAAPTQDRAHIKARDLSAVNSYWKSLLTEDEAAVVERICGPTWRRVQAAMAEVP